MGIGCGEITGIEGEGEEGGETEVEGVAGGMKGFGSEGDVADVDGEGVEIVTGEFDGRGVIGGTVTNCGEGGSEVEDVE